MSFTQKLKIIFICFSGLLGVNSVAHADNLIEVYRQAVINDSNFKQAQADWLAAQQNLPIARAALLPNITLQAAVAGNYQEFTTDASFTRNGTYGSSSMNLILSQPIFNWQLWSSLKQAEDAVKAATANYFFAQEDLIARTVQAYLNVLQTNDILRLTRANKATLAQQYDVVKQKYDVGLARVTDVYETQAQYDQAVAQEIAQVDALENSLETLHQITCTYYTILDGLSNQGIPLVKPSPNDIDAWSETATRQNYQLQAQHFIALSNQENIQVQAGANYPSFGIQGNISDQRQFDRTLTFVNPNETETIVQDLGTLALGMNFNVFSGGGIAARTAQARQQYASASAKEETLHRQVVATTRKAFLAVNALTSQIEADALAIKSSQSALESARAGYDVGTRTLLDLLQDITQLNQRQQSQAVDQYGYMNNYVALKEAAGTLSSADVATLSSWLTKPIDLNAARKGSNDNKPKEPRQPTTESKSSSAAASMSSPATLAEPTS